MQSLGRIAPRAVDPYLPFFHVCLVFDVSFAFDIESGSAQRWRLGAPELKPS
jgi:hypothetical protein